MRVVARARGWEDFRKEMFSKLMLLPVHYFDARSAGALVSKFTLRCGTSVSCDYPFLAECAARRC